MKVFHLYVPYSARVIYPSLLRLLKSCILMIYCKCDRCSVRTEFDIGSMDAKKSIVIILILFSLCFFKLLVKKIIPKYQEANIEYHKLNLYLLPFLTVELYTLKLFVLRLPVAICHRTNYTVVMLLANPCSHVK